MSLVRVRWLDSHPNILLFEFDRGFQVADYEQAIEEAWKLIHTKSVGRFDVAADMTQIRLPPVTMIASVFNAYQIRHPDFSGATIIIGAPKLMLRAVRRLERLLPGDTRFQFVNHIDDLAAQE